MRLRVACRILWFGLVRRTSMFYFIFLSAEGVSAQEKKVIFDASLHPADTLGQCAQLFWPILGRLPDLLDVPVPRHFGSQLRS